MNAPAQRRSERTAVDGLFLLNKPAGITSNQALQRVKRLFNAKKAGHTGSLDPAATGMLPLCFGEATKICAYLLNADKTYRVTARLGEATDTGDADGQVTETAAVPALASDDWLNLISNFVGNIQQIPPMYSALKQGGKRLYEIARSGQVVERKSRPVRIHGMELLEASGSRLVFRVSCSKGTYVRTLVEDIAKAAGTVAHTAKLHRESVGGFNAAEMLDLPSAERVASSGIDALRKHLLPVDSALSDWPEVRIATVDAARFCEGQRLRACRPANPGLVRVYREDRQFLGIGQIDEEGLLAPRRVFR